jgi:hypothetical protein
VAEHPSTAAILTLSITAGTWMLDFAAAVQGGLWEQIAKYTPAAMVSEFQHGLLRLDLMLIAFTLTGAGLGLAGVWMQIGKQVRRRLVESLVIAGLAAVVVAASMRLTPSFDNSENRINSFSTADERALRRIRAPLSLDVHLAPEDPRRTDLDRKVLSKLRRVMPGLRVHYTSATSIGLFEQNTAHYGEIWYDLGGRTSISRVTSSEGVLEEIYSLAGVKAPDQDGETAFRGHPLAEPPKGAAVLFYGLWPALFLIAAVVNRRRSV